MSLPKSDTSSQSSSDDHYSDGLWEYEVELEEEIAAVAETDFDTNEDAGPHQFDPLAYEALAVTYEKGNLAEGRRRIKADSLLWRQEPVEFW